MSNNYFPALIIGAGGTGIKVTRYLQSLADSNLDLDLKQRLHNGSIQMVGIDTDKKSNESTVAIDKYLLDAKDTPESERERLPTSLARLPRNWLHLDRAALNHAIERVHEIYSPGDMPQDADREYHEPLETIRRWFPLKNEKTGDQITKGHSKHSGAAQWRPLGRMSLFLNASRIYETLYAFRDSFGRFMGEEGTHPWSQGFPLTTQLEGGPPLPGSVEVTWEDRFYPKAWGHPKLREAIARHYNDFYGSKITPENVMVFAGGRLTEGAAPLVPEGLAVSETLTANPLPQALVLTAIVIGFGFAAFVLALALAAWRRLGTCDTGAMRLSEEGPR